MFARDSVDKDQKFWNNVSLKLNDLATRTGGRVWVKEKELPSKEPQDIFIRLGPSSSSHNPLLHCQTGLK